MVDDGWMNAREASAMLSFGGLGLFMCGRFAGSWIMRYIKAEKVLFYCAIGTVITTAMVVLNLGLLSFVGLILIYVFEAIMFPTIFALAIKGVGAHTKQASSYLIMAIVGGAIAPVLMGLIGEQQMSLGFIVPLVCFVVIIGYAMRYKKISNL